MIEMSKSYSIIPNLPIPANRNQWPLDLLGDARSIKQMAYRRLQPVPTIASTAVSDLMLTDEKNLNSMMATYNSMYQLRKPSEIRVFLEDNDFLDPIIADANRRLQKYFPNSTIFMEVDQGELVISVGTSLSPEEADERLNKFDEDWWIDEFINSKARLCITVEFQ